MHTCIILAYSSETLDEEHQATHARITQHHTHENGAVVVDSSGQKISVWNEKINDDECFSLCPVSSVWMLIVITLYACSVQSCNHVPTPGSH